VHRSKTHFAQRVSRYATAFERRGIIATYKLHDKLLSNKAADGAQESLRALSAKIVEVLRPEPISPTPADVPPAAR
jgi:hypothetical protein